MVTQETFSNLRLSFESGLNFLVNNVNQFSNLVTVKVGPGLWSAGQIFNKPNWFPTAPGGGWMMLSRGDDAMTSLSVDDFVGVDNGSGHRTGIQALEDIDEIAFARSPACGPPQSNRGSSATARLLKDRFAILDPPDGLDIDGIRGLPPGLRHRVRGALLPLVRHRRSDPGSARQ